MRTKLPPDLLATPEGEKANAILRRCVHCGFCNSVCPTYLHFGDERNGPRGRIHQIKNFLEGAPTDGDNLNNLDLCLTCQACETACPSGVEYLHLLEWARPRVAAAVRRPAAKRIRRRLALLALTSPRLLAVLAFAAPLRPFLSRPLRAYVPRRRQSFPPALPPAPSSPARRIVMFDGCVQAALAPDINAHAAAALSKLNIATAEERRFCCGALELHLESVSAAMRRIRANVDRLHHRLQQGAERIVSSASGCGRVIADYGRLLANDPAYAARARAVSAAHCDIAEFLAEQKDLSPLKATAKNVAFHCPCTLQHGLKQAAAPLAVLSRLGVRAQAAADGGKCCGSAGFYSAENTAVARQLRDDRLSALPPAAPIIATANIGCQLWLQSGAKKPVTHWICLIHPA